MSGISVESKDPFLFVAAPARASIQDKKPMSRLLHIRRLAVSRKSVFPWDFRKQRIFS
jgi:hypothetical protein